MASEQNPNEETVYISDPSRRRRDIRSASRPPVDPVPEVPAGYEGGLQQDFYTIDTVEIAVYFLYQYLPNTQYLDHLFTLVYQQYPRWTELELLKFLLGRVEVTRRSQPEWTDHDLYTAVFKTLAPKQ
jgi:hypothetical protein